MTQVLDPKITGVFSHISSIDIAVGLAFILLLGIGLRWIIKGLKDFHKNYKKKIISPFDEIEKNICHFNAQHEKLIQEELDLEVQIARMHALAFTESEFIWKRSIQEKEDLRKKYDILFKMQKETLIRHAKRTALDTIINGIEDFIQQKKSPANDSSFQLEKNILEYFDMQKGGIESPCAR